MLTCTKCNTEKRRAEFYKNKTAVGREGYTHWCKKCYAENYAANRERQRLSNRRASIKRRYGLTVEEYDGLVAAGCSVCGEKEKRIIMDHCHVSNAVRAPLCDGCNLALGGAKDDPSVLRGLADYLERHAAA